MNSDLTGTYRLDVARSDHPRVVAERAVRAIPSAERGHTYDALLARLESPETLAIERRGRVFTIASSRAPKTTFEADGSERTERLANGGVARVRATFDGGQLVVSSTGDARSDFFVAFAVVDRGRRLKVTRRVYSDRFTAQPVTVRNFYNRISGAAMSDIYKGSKP